MRTITYPLILVTAFIATFPLHAQRANTPLRCTGVAEFVDVVGRDTVIRSRVTFTDTSFSSANHDVGQGALIRYSGRLNATGDIRTLHIEIWPHVADTAGPPAQIADVTVEDTVVNARVAAPSRGVQMQRDRLPAGGVLYMTAAPLFLELLQRHVRIDVGTKTTVPALWLFTRGHVDTVQVSRPALDSLMVRIQDTELAIALAPDRSILSATSRSKDPAESSRLTRRDCR